MRLAAGTMSHDDVPEIGPVLISYPFLHRRLEALERLKRRFMAREKVITTGPGGRRPQEAGRRPAPEAAQGSHRPAEGRRAARDRRARLEEAQGAARAHPLRRPARPGQDHLRHRAAQRAGHVDPDDQRPGPRQAGRPAAVPHQPRRRLDPVHRRDPPHAAGRRGVHLPGDGGLPHRHRARRGDERPDDLDAT